MARRLVLASSSIALVAALGAAHAAEGPLAGEGWGESYWGPIPAPADSVSDRFVPRTRPLWARAADVPYAIVGLPLGAVVNGLETGVVFLDDRNVFYRIGRLLGPRELPYGIVLNAAAGGLNGFGGGATLVHDAFFGPNNRFRLGFRAASSGRRRVVLGLLLGEGGASALQLGAGYREDPNARFFGLGPSSREADESFYRQRLSWVGATLDRRLVAGIDTKLTAMHTTLEARAPGADEDPPLPDVFGDGAPTGFGRRSDGVSLGAALESDTTIEDGGPERGTILRAAASYFFDTDGSDVEHWTYRGEVQALVPLWFSRRALALRAFYSVIESAGDAAPVPFQRLMTNDDPDLLRGFEDFRWRDRGMTVLTAEYRWPVWVGADADDVAVHMYLFTDLGQVFGERDEIAIRNLTHSGGIGLRLLSRRGFVGRLELGASEEETIIRLRADQVFRFQKGGLFHGRNPVPAR